MLDASPGPPGLYLAAAQALGPHIWRMQKARRFMSCSMSLPPSTSCFSSSAICSAILDFCMLPMASSSPSSVWPQQRVQGGKGVRRVQGDQG